MSYRGSKKKQQYKTIASRRIKTLFALAEHHALSGQMQRAHRYVQLARKLSMRHLVPIPRYEKRRFCTHCYHYLVPSVNCRVRLNRGHLAIFCYNCQQYTRIPLK